MIIGNGLIATEFRRQKFDSRNFVVVAAGVSNSAELDETEYHRERDLMTSLLEAHSTRKIIYFSSVAVSNQDEISKSRYIRHKVDMETLLAHHSENYHVFRLPQLVGPVGNAMTITNFLHTRIAARQKITIFNQAERNLLDVEDVVKLTAHVINSKTAINKPLNILTAPRNIKVTDIVAILEELIGLKAEIYMAQQATYKPEINELASLISVEAGVKFTSDYYYKLLKRYYG